MDKRDIYEHLAKIYLDASSKKKKKHKKFEHFTKPAFFVIAAVLLFSLLFSAYNHKTKGLNSSLALFLQPDVAKINFHFNPAKKETYTIYLNNLNLSRYKAVGFSLKKSNYKEDVYLKIEFVNAFNEKSEVYLSNISHKWQDYKIEFAKFKKISDWSDMKELSFVVEEWNAKDKKGVVYLDNTRVLK